jgi:hypothetical protein
MISTVANKVQNSAQLSLFNVAATLQVSYKVGDLVELRKKPIAASYVKKGDVVQVEAVHPIDGSIKFWNKRSERWEFVYPDEVARVLDAEVGVTESIPEPADSVTSSAEVGVTESIPEPADSVTSSAEVGVTESIPEPADSVTSSVSTYRPRGTARCIENCPLTALPAVMKYSSNN